MRVIEFAAHRAHPAVTPSPEALAQIASGLLLGLLRRDSSHYPAVFLSGKRARGTAEPDSDVELALSITGQDPLRRLATFLSRRRAWRGELEAALGLAVQLERARADSALEGGHVELWERA
jgi:hypothetical protein